jgi:hypothetical protein
MAQAVIVISCRGTARSARVRIAKSFGIASGIASHFEGQQRQPGIPTIIRHSDSPVAAGHLIERGSIAIAILTNTAKEIFSEIDRRAVSTADGTHQVANRPAIMRPQMPSRVWVAM